ncbi:MAG: condensation domain-containing protein, partial [Pseudomonadota bacterium]
RNAPPEAEELATFLSGLLPANMVPTEIVHLERLPLGGTGKVDRAALAAMAAAPATRAAEAASETEERIAQILADILEVAPRRVGLNDDFFALGGHSLLAMEGAARLGEAFGTTLTLRDFLANPTVRGLAAALADQEAAVPAAEPRHERPSFAQERLWFLQQLEPDSTRYNVPSAIEIAGQLDIEALSQALFGLVERHEALRTRFVADPEGRPLAVTDPPKAPALSISDLTDLAEADAVEEVRRHVATEARRPFALDSDPILRPVLWRLSAQRHVLLLLLHHIAVDGWSMGILFEELSALYEAACGGRSHALAPAPQLGAQLSAERAFMASAACREEEAWWSGRLAGAPSSHALALDKPRPAHSSGRGGHVAVPLAADTGARIAGFARAQKTTGFEVMLAAAYAALHRWSGEEDLVIGCPVAGRDSPRSRGVVGFLVNTLALRQTVPAGASFRELLASVRTDAREALGRSRLPFDRVVELAGVRREVGLNPLFQVMLSYENTPKAAVSFGELTLRQFEFPYDDCKFDLTFDIEASEDRLIARLEYDADVFSPESAARLSTQFANLVEGVLADPDRSIAEHSLDKAATEAATAQAAQGPQRAAPSPVLPVALARRMACEGQGGRPAIIGDGPMDYGELDARSDALAAALCTRGVGPGTRVGIALERSAASVVAMLAVWRAGGAFVPLDPVAPSQQLRFVLGDAVLEHVIAAPEAARRLVLEERFDPNALIAPDADVGSTKLSRPVTLSSEDPAYIIYTSGSTGVPKGVVV